MPRVPGAWFPAAARTDEVQIIGPGTDLSPADLVEILANPFAEELRDKVGVTGNRDGSAKTTARLLRHGGWFFKADRSRTADTPAPLLNQGNELVQLARRAPIWHPRKSWFVIHSEPLWWLASYCPELRSLRSDISVDDRLKGWLKAIRFALTLSREHGIGVDLNPSNFAYTDTGVVYLDDEVYTPLTFRDIGEAIAARIVEYDDCPRVDWSAWADELVSLLAPEHHSIEDWRNLFDGICDYPLTSRFRLQREQLVTAIQKSAAIRNRRRQFLPLPSQTLDKPSFESTNRPAGSFYVPEYRKFQAICPTPLPVADHVVPPRPRSRPTLIRHQKPDPLMGDLICIISDIHANYPALDAVLSTAVDSGADGFLILGDLVGYGPHPIEVIERIRSLGNALTIRGNHDHLVAQDDIPLNQINRVARASIEWTRERLTSELRHWLASLPVEHTGSAWLAVHGAPCCPDRFTAYVYELTYRDNLDALVRVDHRLCLYGHTHVPFIHRRARQRDEKMAPVPIKVLQPHEYVLLNPGSVGQPRDGDPRAAFALWNRRTNHITFHRVEYPVQSTVSALLSAGLPSDLAYRLEIGR